MLQNSEKISQHMHCYDNVIYASQHQTRPLALLGMPLTWP